MACDRNDFSSNTFLFSFFRPVGARARVISSLDDQIVCLADRLLHPFRLSDSTTARPAFTCEARELLDEHMEVATKSRKENHFPKSRGGRGAIPFAGEPECTRTGSMWLRLEGSRRCAIPVLEDFFLSDSFTAKTWVCYSGAFRDPSSQVIG